MSKEKTMWKLFWALWKDLSTLEQLKTLELMIHDFRVNAEKFEDDPTQHKTDA